MAYHVLEGTQHVVAGLLQLRLQRLNRVLRLLHSLLHAVRDGHRALTKSFHVGGDFSDVLVGEVDDRLHGGHGERERESRRLLLVVQKAERRRMTCDQADRIL